MLLYFQVTQFLKTRIATFKCEEDICKSYKYHFGKIKIRICRATRALYLGKTRRFRNVSA